MNAAGPRGAGPAPGSFAASVYAAALAALPLAGPARLRALLESFTPEHAWAEVVAGWAGRHPAVRAATGPSAGEVAQVWQRAAASTDLAAVEAGLAAAGVSVALPGGTTYPEPLEADAERPAVLFSRAAVPPPRWCAAPRVAIVGTRRCTGYGRDVAFDLGRDLAGAGVVVVSGLALGVDGAAHAGVLDGGGIPVAVVGSGLDVVYPSRHRALWGAVAASGALLSEAPLGARPEPWRFPARNRIVAALADVVVVVESRVAGGSNHTVESAITRSVPVMAVPGPIRSEASGGTNRLIAEGCPPVTHVDDILAALDLASPRRPQGRDEHAVAAEPPAGLEPGDHAVLDALDWTPASFETVLDRSQLRPGEAAAGLARLEAAGLARTTGGCWERCGPSR